MDAAVRSVRFTRLRRLVSYSSVCCYRFNEGVADMVVAEKLGGSRGLRRRRMLTAVAAVAALVLVAFVAPAQDQEASAYTLSGCRVNTVAPTYRFGLITTTYKNATNNAAARWNAAAVPVDFTMTTASTSTVAVSEMSVAGQTYWALTSGACSGGFFTGTVTIVWNTPLVSGPTTDTGRRTIGTHEFGHVLGLNHSPTSSCSGTKAVMVQGSLKYSCGWGSEPWTDDTNGVNYLY